MNWIEFFFGWLVKGQMNVSVFDGVMMTLELFGGYFIYLIISEKIEDKKDKQKRK